MTEKPKKPRTPKQIESAKKNLEPYKFSAVNSERTAKIQSMGGKASAIKRAERRHIRDTLTIMLNKPMKKGELTNIEDIESWDDLKDANLTAQDRMAMAMMIATMKEHNVKAFDSVFKKIGEDGVEKVELSVKRPEDMDFVELYTKLKKAKE